MKNKSLKAIACLFLMLSACVLKAQDKVERPVEINISYGGPHAMLGMVGGARTTFSAMLEVKYTPIKWVGIGIVGGLHDHSRGSDLGPLEEGEVDPGTSYKGNLMLNIYGNWLVRKRHRIRNYGRLCRLELPPIARISVYTDWCVIWQSFLWFC